MWEELQRVLLDGLRAADRLDFSRATVDASHVQAKRGRSSPKVGPSPVDRGRPGSKHHVLTDARGTPLRVSLTGGHRHDVTGLLTLIDSLGPVRASGAAPAQTQDAVCRPRPGIRPLSPPTARAWHHTGDRSTEPAARLGSGQGPLGRRVRQRLAPWPSLPVDPVGAREDMHDALLQLAHCMTLARKHPAFASTPRSDVAR